MDSRLPRSTRFFARLQSFDLECPHCGTVYQIRTSVRRDQNWDPWTGRFHCTQRECERTYVLGILAWPIHGVGASAPPADQVPGPRELAQMRREGGGWWLPDAEKLTIPRPHETNLTTEDDRPERDDDE